MGVLIAYLVLLLGAGTVTALKGKWGIFVLGFVLGLAWIFGAFRLAKPDSWWARRYYSAEKRDRARRELPRRLLLARVAGVAAVALVLVMLGSVKLYRVPSSAMEPALHCPRPAAGCLADAADRIVTVKFLGGRTPGRGDVVAFRIPRAGSQRCGVDPDAVVVMRVIGLPGERIARRDGALQINGESLSELYAPGARPGGRDFPPRRIPADQYFVLGDNRAASCDSSVWGSVPEDRLVSEVAGIYWPPSRIGPL